MTAVPASSALNVTMNPPVLISAAIFAALPPGASSWPKRVAIWAAFARDWVSPSTPAPALPAPPGLCPPPDAVAELPPLPLPPPEGTGTGTGTVPTGAGDGPTKTGWTYTPTLKALRVPAMFCAMTSHSMFLPSSAFWTVYVASADGSVISSPLRSHAYENVGVGLPVHEPLEHDRTSPTAGDPVTIGKLVFDGKVALLGSRAASMPSCVPPTVTDTVCAPDSDVASL